PLESRIIGPPGPTGEIVTVFVLPGCTIGDGSGVRKIEPEVVAPGLMTVILGGVSAGSLTNCWSLSGWVAGRLRTGGVAPGVATVNVVLRGARPRTRTIARTRSPGVSARSRTRLAPAEPAYAFSCPGWAPLTDPATVTDAIRARATPSTLI